MIVSVSIEKRQSARKDTARNILAHKEYVINICSTTLATAISQASRDFPPEISEIDQAECYLLDEMPVISLYTQNLQFLTHERIEIDISELGTYDFKNAHFR